MMLKELIQKHISPILKAAGFRKTGLTWNRTDKDCTYVIAIQPNRVSKDGTVDFTVSIGVFLFDLWNVFWEKPSPKFIKEENCYPRFRLGYLLSSFDEKNKDKWWSLQSEKDIDGIGKEISEILKNTCLPFFENIRSISDIRGVSASTKPKMPIEKLYHAILLQLDGDKAESKTVFEELANDAHWADKARNIAMRLSRSLSP